MAGDISEGDLFLPVHSGTLPPAFAYAISAASKTKLIQEIGAAAQDPTTAGAISRLEAMRVFSDLGTDVLPMFGQLTASPQMGTMAMGLAGQIRLGTPSALQAMVSSNMGTFPQDAQSELANAVCEYRNTDASGVGALGVLLGSQYSDSVRACATHALREIHSPQTLPLLENLLADSSPVIRYDAVIGIAQYAIGFPVARMENKKAAVAGFTPGPNFTSDMYPHYPAMDLFLKNEQEYISYWKTWLAAHPTQ
ncbi:MAG TPA: HEAT repeat domain-containing protein [Bryobacteraceae bacterium]|nr:HEAT repeat domain-containing protein [Bryobacteraceae bacterium]